MPAGGTCRLIVDPREWAEAVRVVRALMDGGLVVPDPASRGTAPEPAPDDPGDDPGDGPGDGPEDGPEDDPADTIDVCSIIQPDGDIQTRVVAPWDRLDDAAEAVLRERLAAHRQEVALAFRRIAALGDRLLVLRGLFLAPSLIGMGWEVASGPQRLLDVSGWSVMLSGLLLALAGLFTRHLLALTGGWLMRRAYRRMAHREGDQASLCPRHPG